MLKICERILKLSNDKASLRDSVNFAYCKPEIQTACNLVYKNYTQLGLYDTNCSEIRIQNYQLLSTTDIHCLWHPNYFNVLLATVSLIKDNNCPLPIESLYPEEINNIRKQYGDIAELTCFAINDNRYNISVECILSSLFFRVFEMLEDSNIKYVVACCNRKHAVFYKKYIGAVQLGSLKNYSLVNNKEAIPVGFEI